MDPNDSRFRTNKNPRQKRHNKRSFCLSRICNLSTGATGIPKTIKSVTMFIHEVKSTSISIYSYLIFRPLLTPHRQRVDALPDHGRHKRCERNARESHNELLSNSPYSNEEHKVETDILNSCTGEKPAILNKERNFRQNLCQVIHYGAGIKTLPQV